MPASLISVAQWSTTAPERASTKTTVPAGSPCAPTPSTCGLPHEAGGAAHRVDGEGRLRAADGEVDRSGRRGSGRRGGDGRGRGCDADGARRGVDALPGAGPVGVDDEVAADDGQALERAVEPDVRRAVLVGGDAAGREALVLVETEGRAVGLRGRDGPVEAGSGGGLGGCLRAARGDGCKGGGGDRCGGDRRRDEALLQGVLLATEVPPRAVGRPFRHICRCLVTAPDAGVIVCRRLNKK